MAEDLSCPIIKAQIFNFAIAGVIVITEYLNHSRVDATVKSESAAPHTRPKICRFILKTANVQRPRGAVFFFFFLSYFLII